MIPMAFVPGPLPSLPWTRWNYLSMRNRQEPALFVIVGSTLGDDFIVPAPSARVAAQVVRHLTEYCPDTQAIWQVNPYAPPGPVVVVGGARALTDRHRCDQEAHAFLLAAGDPVPPVWIALCGHYITAAEFEALDPGMGRPCRNCYQRRHTDGFHRQSTGLPLRAPGRHLHPQLHRSPEDRRVPGGGRST